MAPRIASFGWNQRVVLYCAGAEGAIGHNRIVPSYFALHRFAWMDPVEGEAGVVAKRIRAMEENR